MEEKGAREGGVATEGKTGRRSWPVSMGAAAVLVGIAIAFSAVVNPALGRAVHWDWIAALGPTLFFVLTLALRRRWM